MSVQSIDNTARATPVWRSSWGLLIVTGVVGLLSLWPFWDGLHQMWDWWAASPEDSFGVLIPPVAAFLVWQQKDRLERIPFTGSWWGVLIILLGGACLVFGQLGTIYTLVQYAFVVTLIGLVLSFLGWQAFRLIAIPLCTLFFMIPLPQFFMANLSTTLQLVSSQIGVFVMRLFDISVLLEGNVIDLGGYKLQVADACSGLRYLFPLMTLGFLMAYFYKGALWKRVVLFLSSIPVTVIMNSFRIGVIGVTVERWGIQMAEGFLHEFQGWLVFMVSAALLLIEMAALHRIGHSPGHWRQAFGVELPARTPAGAVVRKRSLPSSFGVATLALLGFVTITFALPRPSEFYPERASFAEYPMRIGEWRGNRQSLEGIYTDELKLDDYVLANYVDASGNVVNIYIAWYNSQRKGEAVHSPRSCLPGGGWQMKEFGQRDLQGVTVGGSPLRVNRSVIELGNQRQLVYYWFQQRGRVITGEFTVKWYLFWDALTRHRTDGALVRLITPLSPTTSLADADARLKDLASRIAPDLPRYVPN
ncbi:MAG: VPLPA-CTERM-specific exosortase XrtD [Steroidobacteraceae bacterium]|jgi:exosortase D (VPLPA-CTERM-specific)